MHPPSSVFVSYRRSDLPEFVRRLASELQEYFGANAVFFDRSTMRPGAEWPEKIQNALRAARVILVVIGQSWLGATDPKSHRRRIDLSDDWVRREVLAALERRFDRERVEVVPVLVGDTPMLDPEDLDPELAPLCDCLALRVPNTGGRHDFDELKEQLVLLGLQARVLPPVTTPRIGKPPRQLTEEEEEQFLSRWSEWEIVHTPEPMAPGGIRRELHRVYEFPTFDLAFRFMSEVVARAVRPYNHHPRWENAFNRVEVWLTTFNLNYRPSPRDTRLAKICEEISTELLRGSDPA